MVVGGAGELDVLDVGVAGIRAEEVIGQRIAGGGVDAGGQEARAVRKRVIAATLH